MSNYQSYSTATPELSQDAPQDNLSGQPSGTHSISINGDISTSNHSQTARVTSSDLIQNTGDWRSTGRTQIGIPTNQIDADTIVTIKGVDGTVSSFIKAGVLTSDGKNFELTEVQQGSTQDSPKDSFEIPPSDDFNQAIDNAIAPFSDSVLSSAIPRAIDAIANGADIDSLVTELSHMAGIDQGETKERFEYVSKAFEEQANALLSSKLGLDSADRNELYEWARSSNQGRQLLKDAVTTQVNGNSVRGWHNLYEAFTKSVAPSIEALKAHGIPTKHEGSKTLVQLRGQWLSLESATRMGMI
jgi:hypothetical protein